MADEGSSQSVRALLRLRQMLFEGAFAPGERMAELPLVERLGVSRTPLRLALSTLAHEGLLELLPTGGYAARAFTLGDVEEAIELRGVLEGTAARFAAERGADSAALAELNDQLDPVVHDSSDESFVSYVDLNERFHALLLEAAGSEVLSRAVAQVVALPFASPSAFVLAEAELPESREILVIANHHHRELVRAIERGEGARAEAVAREHARLARRNLEIVIANRDVLRAIPGHSLLQLP